jgi:hypothetical protein
MKYTDLVVVVKNTGMDGHKSPSRVGDHLPTEAIKGLSFSLESVRNYTDLMVVLKNTGWDGHKSPSRVGDHLLTEAIKGLSLSLESVHNVQCGDGLSAGMLSVGDRITDNGLKECLENCACFFVHHTGDALDTTTTSQTANSRLGDPLDVVARDLANTLCAGLSETFSSFSTTRHDDEISSKRMN